MVLAFQHAGLPLRHFTSPASVTQYTASVGKLVPAVVVSIYRSAHAAKAGPTSLAINGKRVHAMTVDNVRIFMAAGATNDIRRRVARALTLLRRAK